MVAAVADRMPMRKETKAACTSALSSSSAAYHRVDQPPQTVTRRESLNEYTTSTTIGR